jgi:hypothetical protein
MKKRWSTFLVLAATATALHAQGPTVTSWLQNTTVTGSHYVTGNSTAIPDNVAVNTQLVQYSTGWVYVSTHGIPSYTTGPFQDGNPSLASDQNAIFKFPLVPTPNTGTPTSTMGGNIGVFINGVALFDYRDGVAWNNTTSALCGGPGNPPCPGGPTATMAWNRDAVLAEKPGFDCSKGHPAQGNYHHHQNPSAYDLDLTVISTICSLYSAEGLYAIDSMQHSPLIGYAYDGYPIYGAYAYKNADGTGGIVRMKSSYSLNTSMTSRNLGPAINTTYPLGYFREDYQFNSPTASDYLDSHNGRFCVTPEYPNGTYCYFATVDANWNSAYPYVVGPTFYGNVVASKVTSVTEPTTVYTPSAAGITQSELETMLIEMYPNPATDLVALQVKNLVKENLTLQLMDMTGRIIQSTEIHAGSTIAYFDTQLLYAGEYVVKISSNSATVTKKLTVVKQ